MGFILTLKVKKIYNKTVIGCKFPSMGSLGIQGTNHGTPYLQVPLTGAKINNEYHIINNYQ